jgi:hypothetical protein
MAVEHRFSEELRAREMVQARRYSSGVRGLVDSLRSEKRIMRAVAFVTSSVSAEESFPTGCISQAIV